MEMEELPSAGRGAACILMIDLPTLLLAYSHEGEEAVEVTHGEEEYGCLGHLRVGQQRELRHEHELRHA